MKLPGMPNIKKVQANLVHIAYSVYCFGHKHGTEKTERWSYEKFCKGIKIAHEEGAKLWDQKQGE